MEKINTIIEIKHFIECPYCHNSKNRIDHLFNEEGKEISWGYWYCDECGGGYKGIVKGKEVFIEKTIKRKDDSIIFLKNGNILLAIKGMYFNGNHDIENDRYFYEEHTCPINYLKNVEMIINLEDDNIDPHGIFKFITSIPYINLENVEDIKTLLPSF
jgi:hypothetical protein